MNAAFSTLGCKLNQTETEGIAAAFSDAGFMLTRDALEADVIVVNTCAVTSKAEQKARRQIRHLLKQNTKARLIVTGCYAQLNKNEIASIDTRITVVPGMEKPALLKMAENIFSGGTAPPPLLTQADGFAYPPRFEFHSRAFLKIQDGCDNSCAYCAVRLARGKSVSIDAEEALTRLHAIEDAGFAEAVITGVNIGQYKSAHARLSASNSGSIKLAELLTLLLEGTKTISLRLSSLEADVFTPKLFEVLRHERIRPHFHLSVQSANDKILNVMGRRYNRERLISIIKELREIKDDPFLACDIIAGFPGEGESEFNDTLEFCTAADFAWIHAFPFSRRPGTAAYDMKNRVNERTASARVEILTLLAKNGNNDYIKRSVNRVVKAIPVGRATDDISTFAALSENYIPLSVQKIKEPTKRKEFLCKIVRVRDSAAAIGAATTAATATTAAADAEILL
jgi:threonylcarbamoyladenosine tRNA methylthiotransferase MtaB